MRKDPHASILYLACPATESPMRNPAPSTMFPRSQVYFMKTMTSANLTEAAFDRNVEMA